MSKHDEDLNLRNAAKLEEQSRTKQDESQLVGRRERTGTWLNLRLSSEVELSLRNRLIVPAESLHHQCLCPRNHLSEGCGSSRGRQEDPEACASQNFDQLSYAAPCASIVDPMDPIDDAEYLVGVAEQRRHILQEQQSLVPRHHCSVQRAHSGRRKIDVRIEHWEQPLRRLSDESNHKGIEALLLGGVVPAQTLSPAQLAEVRHDGNIALISEASDRVRQYRNRVVLVVGANRGALDPQEAG